MSYRHITDSRHLNLRTVTLAAGLALVTVSIVGGSQAFKGTSGDGASLVTPRVESVAPQFASMADADAASVGLAYSPSAPVQAVSVLDAAVDARDQALGIGQALVGQPSASGVVSSDVGAYLGLGQPGEGVVAASPQFATAADAYFAAMTLAFETLSFTATQVTPGLDSDGEAATQQFGTMADAYDAWLAETDLP